LDVAKKNSSDNATPAAPKRAATRRRGKVAGDSAENVGTTPRDTANELSASGQTQAQPSADEIAQLAYQRYLSRGGADGRDFDDWIEAERELAARHHR
jgi:hypothetical protein